MFISLPQAKIASLALLLSMPESVDRVICVTLILASAAVDATITPAITVK
jgi:hypothetical protein